MRHGGKRQLLAIGRFDGVHDQAHFHGALFNGLRKIQLGPQVLRDLRGERNHFFGGGGEVQALDLAILVVDDFFAAGEEGVAGKNVAGKERFLVVAGDWILHPAVFAGFQVAQTQAGFRFVASDVENLLAVGRKHRPKRGLDLVIWTPEPPSTWYIQISLEPIPNCAFETKMYMPSGAQLGEVKSLLGSFETCFMPVPSGCMIQMFSLPSRSEMNAIHLPSGENLGWLSKAMPPAMSLAWPPSMGSV